MFTTKHLHLHEFKHLKIAQLDFTTAKLVGLQSLVYQWFDAIEVHDPKVAQLLCKMIPARCPFEREIKIFDHTLVRIPSLCKLNPLYEQVVGLRFKALSYLVTADFPAENLRETTAAHECGEDVARYC